MNEAALVLVKNVLFHAICVSDAERYFALKGRLLLAAARYGLYERAYMRLLPLFVRPGAVVVDAGASFGAYTRELARLVGPAGRVIAFEPVPPVRDVLARSSAGVSQVTIIGEALSDGRRSTVDLRVPFLAGQVPEPALARIDAPAAERAWRTFRVPASRLDDHYDLIDGVSFVKADIEGHEAALLEGAARTIETFRPALQLESAGIAPHRDALLAWTRARAYDVLVLDDRRLRVASGRDRLPLNLYLVPAETSSALTSAARNGREGTP